MPKALIKNAVGVITIKKTKPIIIGDIKFPNKIPNLNQILFKGDKAEEFNKPKIKKIIATIAIKQSCEDQKKGITTFIEVILNQELGEPFRRDAMKRPVKVAGIKKEDMIKQPSLI